tara:strand:- start:232 stop:429 length:198 start_codon:yes stop_codon:yes gene_type:complete
MALNVSTSESYSRIDLIMGGTVTVIDFITEPAVFFMLGWLFICCRAILHLLSFRRLFKKARMAFR